MSTLHSYLGNKRDIEQSPDRNSHDILKVEREVNIRNRHNQVLHLTKTQENATQESQEVSHYQAGDHKAARNRQDSITKTNMKHRSTKEAPYNGQQKKNI